MTKKEFYTKLMKEYVELYRTLEKEYKESVAHGKINTDELGSCLEEMDGLIQAQLPKFQGYAYGSTSQFVEDFEQNPSLEVVDPFNISGPKMGR